MILTPITGTLSSPIVQDPAAVENPNVELTNQNPQAESSLADISTDSALSGELVPQLSLAQSDISSMSLLGLQQGVQHLAIDTAIWSNTSASVADAQKAVSNKLRMI